MVIYYFLETQFTFQKSYIDEIALVSHVANFGHVLHLSLDECGFESHQHEQSEQGVIPHIFKTPETNAEYLKVIIF